MKESATDSTVAVGSGVITDLTRYVASGMGREFVSVPTAALPFALPLVIAIVTGTAEQDAAGKSDLGANARTLPAAERAG